MGAADFRSWEIEGIVTFSDGPGGMVRLVIDSPLARAVIYLHGAHVAEFQPVGEAPVLFMSESSMFEMGKPIRGGVPLIFPWFGPRVGHVDSPAHGFARTRVWEIESLSRGDGEVVEVVMRLSSDEATRVLWPHDFVLRQRVRVGRSLEMTLEAKNTSLDEMKFEEAYHTYFAVEDVRGVEVEGLEGAVFIDKLDGLKRKERGGDAVTFTAETEEFYVNTAATCGVVDPGLKRRISVRKSGSETTVVWNPWVAKSKAMPDFGDEEWLAMVCVETANAGENFVTLGVGEIHRMTAEIWVEDLAAE